MQSACFICHLFGLIGLFCKVSIRWWQRFNCATQNGFKCTTQNGFKCTTQNGMKCTGHNGIKCTPVTKTTLVDVWADTGIVLDVRGYVCSSLAERSYLLWILQAGGGNVYRESSWHLERPYQRTLSDRNEKYTERYTEMSQINTDYC